MADKQAIKNFLKDLGKSPRQVFKKIQSLLEPSDSREDPLARLLSKEFQEPVLVGTDHVELQGKLKKRIPLPRAVVIFLKQLDEGIYDR